MRNFNKILKLFTSCFFLASCTPEPLTIKNIPVLTPHLVVSSQVIPTQALSVLVTKSIGALDAGSSTNADSLLRNVIIENALVTLVYGNTVDTLSYISNGIYGNTNVTLTDDEEYFLTVDAPGLGIANASTQLKSFVSFDTVSTHITLSGKDTLASVYYKFKDKGLVKNWYMIDVQRYRKNRSITDNLNPRIFVKVYSDEDFDGLEKEEDFTVPFRRFSLGDTLAVEMANISEDYYNYLKETVDQRNDLSALVSDPLNLPTNVKNGYGYFNMHVPDIRIFRLE